MQRRHLMGAGGNQNPTKAGIPLCRCRHIFSPTVSPCLEKASTHLFPTPSPQLSPLLQFGFNCSVCLLYLALFNPFHRRPAHLRSPIYISSICCLFCLALRWGLVILSVISLITLPSVGFLKPLHCCFLLLCVFPIFYTNIQTPPPLQPKRGRYYHISFRKPLLLRQQLPLRPLHNNLRRSFRHIRE